MNQELFDYEKRHLETLYPYLGECTLFLKKDGSFPLDGPCLIAAYGSGIRYTVKGGTGSGEVNSRFYINIEEGLINKGFKIASVDWLDCYDELRKASRKLWIKKIRKEARRAHVLAPIYGIGKAMEEHEYELPLDYNQEACIYVISRQAGEGCDRRPIKGDLLLADSEIRDILLLNQNYERFMLVINAGGYIDLTPVKEVRNILVLSELGVETGNVLADILLGKQNPTGKLTFSWASIDKYPYELVPPNEDTIYSEGKYVGYRYFDSFKKEVLFPFGYGLSYSDFKIDKFSIGNIKEIITVSADITNVSNFLGKEVLEVYVSYISNKNNVYQDFVAYKKTKLLAKGEVERISCNFTLANIASYDRNKKAYIVKKGIYLVRVGNSSRNTSLAGSIEVIEDVIVKHSEPIFKKDEVNEISTSIIFENPANLKKITLNREDFALRLPSNSAEEVSENIAKLSDVELAEINTGLYSKKAFAVLAGNSSNMVPGAAGETSETFYKLFNKRIIMADGPAGVRVISRFYRKKNKVKAIDPNPLLVSVSEFFPKFIFFILKHSLLKAKKEKKKYPVIYQYATALPIATAIAQSFNNDFAFICGDIVGKEMELFNVDMWLAPAMNIQRTVMCGRNFEYYSEDPYLTGIIASNITKGVQSHKDRYVVIKHYAANNQETNRLVSNSMINEYTFREIYLRGFDLCINEAMPKGVMASYNLINGTHAAENYNLISKHLFIDNAFEGVVMTDWVFHQSEPKNTKHPPSRANFVYKSGVSLFMPGSQIDVDDILKDLKTNKEGRKQLEINASRLYRNFIEK